MGRANKHLFLIDFSPFPQTIHPKINYDFNSNNCVLAFLIEAIKNEAAKKHRNTLVPRIE